jgi:hypothetical protein
MPVSYAMRCDSFEELLMQDSPMRPVAAALNGKERLERSQRLDHALKANCSRLDAVLMCAD